ncbi:holo-ACP synthase [Idiomarina seosinensis]|uniref:holo-ACP synthase n=1 Tax=Idiomarina seosinensis TaxID=281739 RepID=UPI00384C77C9
MPIFGIGTDIVQVDRMQASLDRGQSLVKRILTEAEQRQLAQNPRPAHFLAKRFAAKEACAKAFGRGIASGLSFQHMEVCHDEHGRPLWSFSGTAADWYSELQLSQALLTISDEQHYAVATVLLER